MTQEDKELLLTDICARFRYNVMVNVIDYNDETYSQDGTLLDIINTNADCNGTPYLFRVSNVPTLVDITEIKPYLRPLSSMTSSEKGWYDRLRSSTIAYAALIDWLNENHFDYRGLIEKGLAIEITKENNPYKE